MNKYVKFLMLASALLITCVLMLTACNNKGGEDRTEGPDISDVPTMRPTEVPMRDISGDTPMADTVVYANRMANEVQAY